MLSSIRSALTPNPNHAEDREDTSNLTLDTSPSSQSLLFPHSSPPPFSPIQTSQEDIPAGTGQVSEGNEPLMPVQQILPLDISPDQRSSDRKQEGTDDGLLGPVRSREATSKPSKPYHARFALDGASDDHLQPPLEGAYTRRSPLPSVEPTQSPNKVHPNRSTPTPSEENNHLSSRFRSPQKHIIPVNENSQSRGSPLPSTEPVQSTSNAQPTQRAPSHSENHVGLEPKTGNIPQPSEMATEKSRKQSLPPPIAERLATMSEAPDVRPQLSPPADAQDVKTSTLSKAQTSKRKREEVPSDTETKSVKKQRSQPKKKETSTATVKPRDTIEEKSFELAGRPKKDKDTTGNVEQQDAATTEAPKRRGRPKKQEGSTGAAKQKGAVKDEVPKTRGRPKKGEESTGTAKQQGAAKDDAPKKRARPKEEEEEPTHRVKSQRVSEHDTPAKRGRPKRTTAPPTTRIEKPSTKNTVETQMPKKRGRPARVAPSAQVVEPASLPKAATPNKRGRPKKEQGAALGVETEVASTANTPRQKGRPKTNEVTAKGREPKGSSQTKTTKKRGQPKATGQDETAKNLTQRKRGRPKKK